MVNKINQKMKGKNYFIDVNRANAGKLGAVEAVVKTLKMHLGKVSICITACGVLLSLTKYGK